MTGCEQHSASTGRAAPSSRWGFEARSRALLCEGAAAETLYRKAIERLRRTRGATALARAHLLNGEWLRREHRREDGRIQLDSARKMSAAIGMDTFAGRAERELLATGERVRKRTVETREDLTAQEAQIARLAREGLSNLRSAPVCSSARAPWSTTSTSSSPSSAQLAQATQARAPWGATRGDGV